MAGHGRRDAVEPRLQRVDGVVVGDLVGEVADQRLHIGLAEHGRRLAHRDRAGPEALDAEAEAAQRLGMRGEPRRVVLGQVDDLRQKQHLRRQRSCPHRLLQRLVDQPLMCGMLVDDDQRIARLRDDVVLVDLRARSTEPRLQQVGIDRHRAGPRVAAVERPGVEFGLRRLAEALLERPRRRAREIIAGRDPAARKAGLNERWPLAGPRCA